MQNSKRSGKSAEEIYVPSLWYYDLLTFTIEQEVPEDSIDNIEIEDTFSNLESEQHEGGENIGTADVIEVGKNI